MSNTDDQRAAFEAWAKSMHASTDRYSARVINGITMEGYRNMSVQLAWRAWQAAIDHARLNPQADTQLATTHVPAP